MHVRRGGIRRIRRATLWAFSNFGFGSSARTLVILSCAPGSACCLYSCSQHLTTPGWGGVGSRAGRKFCARRQNARADKTCTQAHATLGSRPAPARLF